MFNVRWQNLLAAIAFAAMAGYLNHDQFARAQPPARQGEDTSGGGGGEGPSPGGYAEEYGAMMSRAMRGQITDPAVELRLQILDPAHPDSDPESRTAKRVHYFKYTTGSFQNPTFLSELPPGRTGNDLQIKSEGEPGGSAGLESPASGTVTNRANIPLTIVACTFDESNNDRAALELFTFWQQVAARYANQNGSAGPTQIGGYGAAVLPGSMGGYGGGPMIGYGGMMGGYGDSVGSAMGGYGATMGGGSMGGYGGGMGGMGEGKQIMLPLLVPLSSLIADSANENTLGLMSPEELRIVTAIIQQSIWKQDAVQALNQDDLSPEQMKAIEQQLREILTEAYDTQLERHEHEVKRIEERIVQLRSELVRRRDAKQRVVDVQLGRIVLESQGLLSGERNISPAIIPPPKR